MTEETAEVTAASTKVAPKNDPLALVWAVLLVGASFGERGAVEQVTEAEMARLEKANHARRATPHDVDLAGKAAPKTEARPNPRT